MAGASILCATDLSAAGPRTVDLAIAASKAFDVRLDLVHVLDDADSWWPDSPDLQEAAQAARDDSTRNEQVLEAKLEAEKARVVAEGVECEAFVARGRPWRIIAELADQRGSFLLTIGPFGSSGRRTVDRNGVTETVIGSTAERILRAATRPVFIASGDDPIPDGLRETKWFVGVDFSDSSLAAVNWAKRAAARVGGELHLANVVIPAGGEDKPDEERTWRQVLRDQSKIEAGKKLADYVDQHAPDAHVHQVVSPDYPSHALCKAASGISADVLVIGTHRQNILGRLLIGSTAARCLRIAPIPVLMVPESAG